MEYTPVERITRDYADIVCAEVDDPMGVATAREAIRTRPMFEELVTTARRVQAGHDGEGGAVADIWLVTGLAAWHQTGRNTFFPTLPLLRELQASDITKELPTEALRAPHPIFQIAVPDGLGMQVHSRVDRLPLSGFLVIADRGLLVAGYEVWHRCDVPGATPAELAAYVDVRLGAAPMLGILAMSDAPVGERANLAWSVLHLTHDNLEECVAASYELHSRTMPAGAAEQAALVLKTMLYINSEGAEIAPWRYVPDGQGTGAKARRLHERKRALFGTRVQLGSAAAPTPTCSASEGAGVAWHMVRGHWKHQRHGPKSVLTKLIWIRPYERGEDEVGRVVQRDYVT